MLGRATPEKLTNTEAPTARLAMVWVAVAVLAPVTFNVTIRLLSVAVPALRIAARRVAG